MSSNVRKENNLTPTTLTLDDDISEVTKKITITRQKSGDRVGSLGRSTVSPVKSVKSPYTN